VTRVVDMRKQPGSNLMVRVVRWIARIWSGLMAIAALLMAVVPDPYTIRPIPTSDWIELGFYWLAIVGVLVAWRWELLGGIACLAGLIGHTVAFRIASGSWHVQVLPIIVFGVPALVFLACWALSCRQQVVKAPE